MKISKQSWHYQIYEALDGRRYNVTLCSYTRKLMLATFIAMFVIIASVILSLLIIDPIWSLIMWVINGGEFMCVISPECNFLIADTILLGLAISFMCLYLIVTGIRYLWSKWMNIPVSDKAEGMTLRQILREYRRAIKDKICPIVEFID